MVVKTLSLLAIYNLRSLLCLKVPILYTQWQTTPLIHCNNYQSSIRRRTVCNRNAIGFAKLIISLVISLKHSNPSTILNHQIINEENCYIWIYNDSSVSRPLWDGFPSRVFPFYFTRNDLTFVNRQINFAGSAALFCFFSLADSVLKTYWK